MKKSIFWILGGAAALYFISRFSFSKKVNFLLKSAKPGGNLFSPDFLIVLAAQNPTNQKVTIKSIVGDVNVNDQYLGNVSSFGDQVILPNSETDLRLKAKISAIGIFYTIKNLISKKEKISVNFTGTANVEGISVPINETRFF